MFFNKYKDVIITELPKSGSTVSGYGKKLPTHYKVRFNNRLYRVYATCCSNTSTFFIMSNKKRIIVDWD